MPKPALSAVTKPKIAIGGFWHETNTFAAGCTYYDDFEAYQFARKSELIECYRDTNTELGGMIEQAGQSDLSIIPTLFAAAVPSGIIEKQSFIQLVDELVGLLREAIPLDGIALTLHGAAVADGFDDADAYILERTRELVGVSVPIVATFDYHANLSDSMVNSASVLIGYDTYPHVDMAKRGKEAVSILCHLIDTKSELHRAFRKIPLLTSPLRQQTDEYPMANVMQQLCELESRPAVACASVAMGFPYSDVPHLGASVMFYGSDELQLRTAADAVASTLWNFRTQFQEEVQSVQQCIQLALNSTEHPVIIVEPSDNIGGGSAGDGTGVLKELIEAKADNSVVVINDPEAVMVAERAGVDSKVTCQIGGKTDKHHGTPVEIDAIVKTVSDGNYTHKGSYMTGYVTAMGPTAVVESSGVKIVLTSRRSMPFDAEQLRSLNIEPEKQKIIVVKSAIAWKAAYGDMAKMVLVANTPGVCAADLSRLSFNNRPKPLYPLEQDTTYTI